MTTTDPPVYRNGNTRVSLFTDGTKVREWEGLAQPEFPESIDLKITDFCDAGCPFCHEMSTRRGLHAPAERVIEILSGMLPGTEVAIGGGNPLSHPKLDLILRKARELGLVPNLTINATHVDADRLAAVRRYTGGIGISHVRTALSAVASVADSNTVLHLIAGIDRPFDLFSARNWGIAKFLILGYKKFGFGAKVDEERLARRLAEWRYWLRTILSMPDAVVSFDNLGLEQLAVRSAVPTETWDESYMGDDGQFTFYVDAVRDEFAVSSTSARTPRGGMSIGEMFAKVREETAGSRVS